MTVQSTTQTTATTTAQYSTTQKTASSDFEETLNQTQNTTQASTEPSEASKEAHFKYVERFSYEFIKNTTIEELENCYNDLPQEEREKIKTLRGFANKSDNEILNKVLFDKAEKMSLKEATLFSFQMSSEMYHYKQRGVGQRFIHTPKMLEPKNNSVNTSNPDTNSIVAEHRLSHNQAFEFLLDMTNSSKEGMNNKSANNELRGMFEDVYEEYSQYLEDYNAILRKNLTGNV